MGCGKYYGESVEFARENRVGAGGYDNVFDKSSFVGWADDWEWISESLHERMRGYVFPMIGGGISI